MKLAHLADLHVGFRQFDRSAPGGINQREADVQAAVRTAVDGVLAAAPDLIIVAGDVFHQARPSNTALLFMFGEVRRLRQGLLETPLVVIAGNHDTPRTAETGLILPLFRELGALVVTQQAAQLDLGGLILTCVPSAVAGQPLPEPVPGKRNVLAIHGDVPGFGAPAPREALDPDVLAAGGWDYVALGHYHVAAEVRPRVWYSGSLEYTSSNPWAEIAGGPKGWLSVELETGRVELQAVPTRRFLDLPPINGQGLDEKAIDRALAERVAEFDITDAVVRLIVIDVNRAVRRAIDHAQVRGWKARALHFQLELRLADGEASSPERRARIHASLEERLTAFLSERSLPPGVERGDFVEEGLGYFRRAGDEREQP